MKLSIIIVNYNVKYFIEQCLFSVQKAIEGISAEVYVVDNNSVDGSCELIKGKFPWVKLIENKKNTGFSVANNQAIRESTGEYVILLNPDTVVQESTFRKVLDFMDEHQNAGGLGVKMIDGKGHFLPESKRGIPTPQVAFFKMFGFSKIFPKSKLFSKYHLGYLDNNQIHQVEILSGAFMMLRKTVLDEIGLLDEDYFMYGEDIDLSYRIIKAGYKNYYYPDTTIIHYKGESTKKGSVNYVMVFYKAMIIFAKKQLSAKHSKLLTFLINIAIFIRAFIAIINRLVKQLVLPVLDGLLLYGGFVYLAYLWEQFKFDDLNYYPDEYIYYILPSYVLIWVLTLFFNRGYDKPLKIKNALKGVLSGFLVIIVVYAFINEQYRYSRALIFLDTLWTFSAVLFSRLVLHISGLEGFKIKFKRSKRIILAGDSGERERVKNLLYNTGLETNIVGYVGQDRSSETEQFLGQMDQLREVILIHKVDEIIFCLQDVSANQIISHMLQFSDVDVDFKIAPPEAISIIGSNSINTAGELYTLEINSVARTHNKRKKRVFDIAFSLFAIVCSPFLIIFVRKPLQFLRNAFNVLFGTCTWVAYNREIDSDDLKLPSLKKGIVAPINGELFSKEIITRANIVYAKDYAIYNDFLILLKHFKFLGN